MDHAPAPRTDRGSEATAEGDRTQNGADALAVKDVHGGRRNQRSTRTDGAAEADDEAGQQPEVRKAAQQPEHADAGNRKAVGQQNRALAPEQTVEQADADHS